MGNFCELRFESIIFSRDNNSWPWDPAIIFCLRASINGSADRDLSQRIRWSLNKNLFFLFQCMNHDEITSYQINIKINKGDERLIYTFFVALLIPFIFCFKISIRSNFRNQGKHVQNKKRTQIHITRYKWQIKSEFFLLPLLIVGIIKLRLITDEGVLGSFQIYYILEQCEI